MTPMGDRDSNGFSARGWDRDATTIALGYCRDVLAGMSSFVTELAEAEGRGSDTVAEAATRLGERRTMLLAGGGGSGGRVGPMLSSNTKLSIALLAVEEYYASVSDGVSGRWRMARSSPPPSPPPGGLGGGGGSGSSRSTLDRRRFESFERADANHPDGKERVTKNDGVDDTSMDRRSAPTTPPESMIRGMLPRLRGAATKAALRTSERERGLAEIRDKIAEAESILRKQKEWAASQWRRVADEESNIDRLYALKKMEQHELYEDQRRRRERESLDRKGTNNGDENDENKEEEGPLSREVWEMVSHVATSMEDFAHTGYSPRALLRKPNVEVADLNDSPRNQHYHYQQYHQQGRQSPEIPLRKITRADVERESDIRDIRMVAMAADESVEDAAGKLLNMMSKGDTTYRSAKLAAESCLLSECNGAVNCLRSLVAIERANLEDRSKRLGVLEAAVDAIDVRRDIDCYITADKGFPGGRSIAGEDDDGGIAAALAVLNSHCEGGQKSNGPRKYGNIERPCHFEGWGEDDTFDDEASADDVQPELFEDVIKKLFEDSLRKSCEGAVVQSVGPRGRKSPPSDEGSESHDAPDIGLGSAPGSERMRSHESHCLSREEKLKIAINALAEKTKRGQSFRKTILYELNNQRSKKTEVEGEANFDALCRIFNSFLSGCGRESIDVSNAKMLMILSQTFYMIGQVTDNVSNECSTTRDRQSRIYVKSNICHHNIWSDDDYWDQALYQCVSESLLKSGVLLNYLSSSMDDGIKVREIIAKEVKWHDLSPSEYAGAASQVHSVVFAQLGTLSHSMLELGCGIPRACNFVRRVSIRYQLPLSLRITLMQHLTKNRS
ncbi:hypothetical protein ACHAXA_008731 [Cyclostephanos tholiformis]|uniref:Uncharacterized protein n=1 Tax=Cyclostephanos tholiformis TaxID=382380 RepID=A0ABD3REN6_9STRA